MWDFTTTRRFIGSLLDKRKDRTFCSINHSITGDMVSLKAHGLSKFIEAGKMSESELLWLFMAIMSVWDDTPSKKCEGSRDQDTYEKSFFLNRTIFENYCIPYGTNYNPCGYQIVYNKIRQGEGKREYSIFCVKKLSSRDLRSSRVHNHKGCYLHAGIPDERALIRKQAEKRQHEERHSEINDLREEVNRLRKRNCIMTGHEYPYGAPPPPVDSVARGSYVYYAHPQGVLPPPTYPHPDTGY